MKVLLIYPTTNRLFEQPPLGLMYIAGYLRQFGHEVMIFEGSVEIIEVQMILWGTWEPDVIGITCMTPMYEDTIEIAKFAKLHFHKAIVVVGGAHATIMPETFYSPFDYEKQLSPIDFVVIGEGEKTMEHILSEGDVSKIDGIALWDYHNHVLHYNCPQEPLDVGLIPFPARDLVCRSYFEKGSTAIMASRGCPFNCSFCQPTLRKIFGSKVRRRYALNVLEEMFHCHKKFDIHHFEFFDDTFTSDKTWVQEFAGLKKNTFNGVKMSFEILTRVDMVDYDSLKTLKEAGLNRISFGVESGSQEILNTLCKGITIEQTKEAFEICHKLKIRTHALFMIGSPHETRETIAASKKLLKEIKPDTMFVSITTPLPETYLYDQCIKDNTMLCSWKDIDYYRQPSIALETLTPQDIIKAKWNMLSGFYGKKLLNPLFAYRFLKGRSWEYVTTVAKHIFRRE